MNIIDNIIVFNKLLPFLIFLYHIYCCSFYEVRMISTLMNFSASQREEGSDNDNEAYMEVIYKYFYDV